ncbi:MAG: hypothetical protein ACETVW_00865 [Dehalococcoidia bacterium]
MEDILVQLLKNARRSTYEDYLRDDLQEEKRQIKLGMELEKEVVKQFATYVKKAGLELSTVSEDDLQWAREVLASGQVAAIDATRQKPKDIISGVFCEIGLAEVTYKTMQEPIVKCMSIMSRLDGFKTVQEYYDNIHKQRANEQDVTTAMIYWELESCLESQCNWVFKDGPILHPDLVWKGSPTSINILEKVVSAKNIIGVVKDFRAQEGGIPLLRYGKLLQPLQYLVAFRGANDWMRDIGRDTELTKIFKAGPGREICRGVFKARQTFYGFEVHQDMLKEGIALLMADALNNKRGIPNLVDLADHIARTRFPYGLYKEKIEREFLSESLTDYFDILDDHELRGY